MRRTIHNRSPARVTLRCTLLACAAVGVALTSGLGCASKKVSENSQLARGPVAGAIGSPEPMILSNDPQTDAAAFRRADRDLITTKWGVMDELAPKPMWDSLPGKRHKLLTEDAEAATAAEAAAPSPSTQPASPLAATLPAVLTTRPTNKINEADLPVQIAEMPDGKLRLIWVLRSYGGTNITTAQAAGTSRRTVTVTPADLAPLVAAITPHLGAGGAIVPLPRENTLVITCAKDAKDNVLGLLDGLDIPPRQVQITAKIFEVSHDFDYQQGARILFNRLAADGTQTATSVFDTQRFIAAQATGQQLQGSVLSLMKNFQDAGVSLEASFQLLAESGLIRVVSSPRMTVAAGQTGYMLAGQELPIQSTNIAANVVTTATSYKPVGVQLYITPQAVGPDGIKLHAISIVSSVAGFTQLPTLSGSSQPLVNPIIDSREAETAVTIQNGHTLVISGLRMIRTTTRENKIPGLGDLPAIGNLFKNHRSQQQMTDLYFFVTPTLL
jgi:type II secretory pathway component GspD/PulD (secretin)